jgi:hypothetical protein
MSDCSRAGKSDTLRLCGESHQEITRCNCTIELRHALYIHGATAAPVTVARAIPGPPQDDQRGKGEGDHVCISPERDTPPRASALGPKPGREAAWRDTPQFTVTRQVVGWVLLAAALLVLLGLLVGWAWTNQALQPKLRRQAEERRRLNAEWSAVRAARRQQAECPHCASPLSEQDWYYAPILVEDPPDDD